MQPRCIKPESFETTQHDWPIISIASFNEVFPIRFKKLSLCILLICELIVVSNPTKNDLKFIFETFS